MKAFVFGGEKGLLECIAQVTDSEERTAEDRNAAIGEHNRMVSAMEHSAAEFNAQLRSFKAKQ